MSKNGNTVNMEKKAYHHGDLRAALVGEGLRLLNERDGDSLSLREVARNVGVTATSVYRHFPDKEALMTVLAREGLAQLAAAQRSAAQTVGEADAFAATGRAYVRFALANPALFRLIFTSPHMGMLDPDNSEPDAMALLKENAAALSKAAPDDPATAIEIARAWALVHGLAMLMLDGQIPADEAIIERVIAG